MGVIAWLFCRRFRERSGEIRNLVELHRKLALRNPPFFSVINPHTSALTGGAKLLDYSGLEAPNGLWTAGVVALVL